MKKIEDNVDRKTSIMNGLVSFLTRFRRIIVSLLIVIAVGVVALIAFLSIQNNRNERALEAVESLQEDFRQWNDESALSETTNLAGEFEVIAEIAAEVISDYPNTYAAVRARMIVAEGNFTLENWLEAADNFALVAEASEGTYLASVAHLAAAVSLENAGSTDQALATYRQVAENGDMGFGYVPRALFSIGRMEESRDAIVAATDAYQRLIDDYPTSSWTNLARNRIITLTVEGRVGE